MSLLSPSFSNPTVEITVLMSAGCDEEMGQNARCLHGAGLGPQLVLS